jgi:hypothetical protein
MLHSVAQRVDDLQRRRDIETDQVNDNIGVELRDSRSERTGDLFSQAIRDN